MKKLIFTSLLLDMVVGGYSTFIQADDYTNPYSSEREFQTASTASLDVVAINNNVATHTQTVFDDPSEPLIADENTKYTDYKTNANATKLDGAKKDANSTADKVDKAKTDSAKSEAPKPQKPFNFFDGKFKAEGTMLYREGIVGQLSIGNKIITDDTGTIIKSINIRPNFGFGIDYYLGLQYTYKLCDYMITAKLGWEQQIF